MPSTINGSDNFNTNDVGINQADVWRMTSDISVDTDPIINVERADDPSFEKIGSGMTHSSGVFSFPATGIYLVNFSVKMNVISNDNVVLAMDVTVDGGASYDTVAQANGSAYNTKDTQASQFAFINVTDVANVKVKFRVGSVSSGSKVLSSTDANLSAFTFIRLGGN